MVPTNVGGNDSTYYSDYYSRTSENSLVLARSCYYTYGGVAFVQATSAASHAYFHFGSRLAFRGIISEVSPEQFKKLPVL